MRLWMGSLESNELSTQPASYSDSLSSASTMVSGTSDLCIIAVWTGGRWLRHPVVFGGEVGAEVA